MLCSSGILAHSHALRKLVSFSSCCSEKVSMRFMMWTILTCMLTPIQVLSKAEKRRTRKQEKAAAKALNAQQQPACSAAAPLQPLYGPPVHPPTTPADPVLSSSGPRMPNQTVSSAHLPSPPEISVAQPPPNGSSPQLDASPMPSHKSSEQMTAAKPESPQVADVPHGSLPSSSSRSPQARRSSSPGVPVLEDPSASSSSKVQSVASAHSAATAAPPVKADMASAPKPIARDPHTPPEQSNPRPSHSPPTPSALPAKNEPQGAHHCKHQVRQVCPRMASSSNSKSPILVNGLVREIAGGGLSMDRRSSPTSQLRTSKPKQPP